MNDGKDTHGSRQGRRLSSPDANRERETSDLFAESRVGCVPYTTARPSPLPPVVLLRARRVESPPVKKPPLFPIYQIQTLRGLVHQAVQRYENKAALASKREGNYVPISFAQLGRQVEQVATALLSRGFRPGDRIGILGENRTEWAIAYLAAVSSGMVAVPIDRDLPLRDIRHVIDYSGTSAVFCGRDYIEPLRNEMGTVGSLKLIISLDEKAGLAEIGWGELVKAGKKALSEGVQDYREIEIQPDDLAAIIFTSGTTGSSKAVMLTHRNLASNVMSTSQMVSISNDDVVLSVLPLHHTYECTCGFLTALYQGASIYHAENLRRIAENLGEARATVMLGVPLLFESMYRRIEKGIRENGAGKVALAKKIAGLVEGLFHIDLRRRLFKSLHRRFGGRLRLLISGGAAINPQISRGFRELGINFIQGYGMTESSPLIAVNRENCLKDGSAGLVIPGVEIRFREGEILVRGDNVMKGYYLNPAATEEAFEEGWLRTGDLGHLDEDGFLFISGRKKSVIVTPNGKNVYPEELEAILNESPYVLESLVWGGAEADPSRVEVEAILVPDTDAFDRELGPRHYDAAKIREILGEEVKKCNAQVAQYKRIKKFTIRQSEFEKTTTRKIKRYLYTAKKTTLQGNGESSPKVQSR